MPSTEKKKQEIKLLLGDIPTFLSYPINFYFNARSPQRTIAAASWFNTASEVD
jgi:hypothetical protein